MLECNSSTDVRLRLIALVYVFVGILQAVSAQDVKTSKKVLGLELGAKLPELMVTTQHGKEVPLVAAMGDRWVFVFFYPKALTGG